MGAEAPEGTAPGPPRSAEGLRARVAAGERAFAGARLGAAGLAGLALDGVDLSGAEAIGADLSGASLRDASLARADLRSADLTGADLRGASLHGARLRGACLAGARLEGARGLVLDDNDVRGARFAPRAPDPWSELRRRYTGPMLLFHLLLLVAFVVPYAARTLVWVTVNHGQAQVVAAREAAAREAEAQRVAAPHRPAAPGDPDLRVEAILPADPAPRPTAPERLANRALCLGERCEAWSVWQVLLGVDKGPTHWLAAAVLLLYNLCRLFLTWRVAPLRDEEERSGYAPPAASYLALYPLHRLFRLLLVGALGLFAWNLAHWLAAPVWLPAS